MAFWLMKSEPNTYSIDDLERDGTTMWDSIRNYQARNYMRDAMEIGDRVLFYHSNADPPGVAGIAEVSSEAYPDPVQFDTSSKYCDHKSDPENPRWILVDVDFIEKFPAVLSLQAIKADEALAGMMVAQKGSRLSIQPVAEEHYERVRELAREQG